MPIDSFFLFFSYGFIIFRYHLSFGILFIAGMKKKPVPVILLEKVYKKRTHFKQARKQMSILDFCKPAEMNKLNEVVIENRHPNNSTPTTSENGRQEKTASSVTSVAAVKLKRLSLAKLRVSLNVENDLQIYSTIPLSTIEVSASKSRNKRNSTSSNSSVISRKRSVEKLENEENNLGVDLISVQSSENSHKRSSPSLISSTSGIKSRKRPLEKSETSPLMRKRQKTKGIPVPNKIVNKKSRQSISKKSSEKTGSKSDIAEEEDIYAVEKVVDIDVIDNVAHFNVKWKGYSKSENTWEPLTNLSNCVGLLNNFLSAEIEANKTTIEDILLDLNTASVLSDEEAFEKLRSFDILSTLTHLVLLAKMKQSYTKNVDSYNVIRKKLLEENEITMYPFWLRRNEQLRDLQQWQNDINKSDKSSQITVENTVDFEKSPSSFEYINDCVAGEDVVIPNDPLVGCDCEDGCSSHSNCCGKQLGSKYAYNADKSIRLPQGNAIFECNKLCKCGPDCTNRVVQQGRKHSLTIFKTSNGRGWGVRTDRVIAKGQYICEYVGEIITNKEAEARGHIYDAEKRTYLFDLDYNSIVENKENLYTIDACKMGNVSRMINHSCDPNIGTWSVWINCLDLDIPKICFYALRRIEAGEELSFDYLNFSVHDGGAKIDDDQSLSNVKTNFECRCNSTKCRKYIFDPSLLNPVEK